MASGRHSGNPATVKCPTCGTPVEWTAAHPWRPFCSERCRLIDLGSWLDGSHRIPTDEEAAHPGDEPERD